MNTIENLTPGEVAEHLIAAVPQAWNYAAASKSRKTEMERYARKEAKRATAATPDEWSAALALAARVAAGEEITTTNELTADLARYALGAAGVDFMGNTSFSICGGGETTYTLMLFRGAR